MPHLIKEGALRVDLEDEITRETLVTYQGSVVHARVCELMDLAPALAGLTVRLKADTTRLLNGLS